MATYSDPIGNQGVTVLNGGGTPTNPLTVAISQTTPGTTNNVNVDNATGAGSTIGATTDAAVVTNANGTISSKLRGIVSLLVSGIKVLQTFVGATAVTGISEVDAYTTGATGNHTISAGAIAVAVNFSSDFAGTVLGATYTAANQGVAFSRVAQPGNLLPAIAITRSAGSYDYYVAIPI